MIRPLIPALFALLAWPALADDASKAQKLDELMDLMNQDQMTRQMMDAVKRIQESFRPAGMPAPSPEQQAVMDRMTERVFALFSNAMSWDKLKPQLVPIYEASFTEAQIDDLLAFHNSPTGRALAEKGPELMTKMTGLMQQRMQTINPEFQKLMQEFTQELAATMGVPLPPKPAPAKQ